MTDELKWLPHDGGRNPFTREALCYVRLRNGEESGVRMSDCLFWEHDGRGDDIMYYREEEPQ